ncbi:VOC family protein [Peribacillus sp. SCS-155]|uniref:VOC family protein n=1 Tax=Peribacillus sedimenti TaxID=3115297 RepID=UPI003906BAF7
MVPQRLSLVTIGSWNVAELRKFYKRLGWSETEWSSDEYAVFQTAGCMFSIWGISELAEDASLPKPESKHYLRGITLSINVDSPEEVDTVAIAVEKAGGKIVKNPENAFWGGRTFVFLDPENNAWEVAFNPKSIFDERGAMIGMNG